MRRHYPELQFTPNYNDHSERKHNLESKEKCKGTLNVFVHESVNILNPTRKKHYSEIPNVPSSNLNIYNV